MRTSTHGHEGAPVATRVGGNVTRREAPGGVSAGIRALPPPRHLIDSCAAQRSGISGCRTCSDVCPHSALRFTDSGPSTGTPGQGARDSGCSPSSDAIRSAFRHGAPQGGLRAHSACVVTWDRRSPAPRPEAIRNAAGSGRGRRGIDSNSTRTESFVAIHADPEAAGRTDASKRANHNVQQWIMCPRRALPGGEAQSDFHFSKKLQGPFPQMTSGNVFGSRALGIGSPVSILLHRGTYAGPDPGSVGRGSRTPEWGALDYRLTTN
jgi:ferredoxin